MYRARRYTAKFIILAICLFVMGLTNAAAQKSGSYKGPIAGGFDKIHSLPPGGPAPRTSDGHPDFSGRWYPNKSGKMLQGAYPVDPDAMSQFDAKQAAEPPPVFKQGVPAKYTRTVAYGDCDQAGTPSVMLEQLVQHAPLEIMQTAGKIALMYEYPLDVRMIYTNGRQHPKDPDPTFNGDSAAHWEGDTLVVDVIAIDPRLRIITGTGGGNGTGAGFQWFGSEKQHVVERFSRPSKNYLVYQVTIEDPVVLAKPWSSAPRVWSLAAPDDEWSEVFCTHNEEPAVWKEMIKKGVAK